VWRGAHCDSEFGVWGVFPGSVGGWYGRNWASKRELIGGSGVRRDSGDNFEGRWWKVHPLVSMRAAVRCLDQRVHSVVPHVDTSEFWSRRRQLTPLMRVCIFFPLGFGVGGLEQRVAW